MTPLSCRLLRLENKPPPTRRLSPAPPLALQMLAGATLFKTADKQACLLLLINKVKEAAWLAPRISACWRRC